MTNLSVNINKVALIRNARGEHLPDLNKFAHDCEEYGAQGITVHPRPDERHIRYSDLAPLKALVTTEFNIEGYPSSRFMEEIAKVKPHQVTLVPDPPGVLTSHEGWDIQAHGDLLSRVIKEIHSYGSRVSIFMDAKPEKFDGIEALQCDRVELYTGDFARDFANGSHQILNRHAEVSKLVAEKGIGLNAGHDLNRQNLGAYVAAMTDLLEVSIGHALISDALYLGIHNTIQIYQGIIERSMSGEADI